MDKLDEPCWENLCKNHNAVNIIEQNLKDLFFNTLSSNPNAIHILKQNMDEIWWTCFCGNTNPTALYIIKDNLYQLDISCWRILCTNHNAIKRIEQNLDKLDKHCWENLCKNPEAIPLLEQNPDKIDWDIILENPSIFEINIGEMREQCKPFAGELTAYVFHPERISRLCNSYGIEFEELLEIY